MMQLSKAHVFSVSLQLARNRHAANNVLPGKPNWIFADVCSSWQQFCGKTARTSKCLCLFGTRLQKAS